MSADTHFGSLEAKVSNINEVIIIVSWLVLSFPVA